MDQIKYASINEAPIFESVVDNKGEKTINRILLGTYVQILDESGDWYNVNTAGPNGWMHKDSLSDKMGLKVFFLDVGQGDGLLIEIGNLRILIDAGPNENMYKYLTKWQYKYLLDKEIKVHIDYLIVSHFDIDHFNGFIEIINDTRFTFGTICHSGILKFLESSNIYNSGLGNVVECENYRLLTEVFDDLLNPYNHIPFNTPISRFLHELNFAHAQQRVSRTKRYESGDVIISQKIDGLNFKIEVLGPFTEVFDDRKAFVYWEDEGKTINGHSLVIKVTYGERTFLLGGDLNTKSQNYLMSKYLETNPFEVDVAKSCHHGASDFTEKFMELVNPYATVISSGDNEGHSHPRADAIGCAGKYSKSKRPLVYSTELARSTNLNKNEILFGMINLRCNGKDIFMSQMKEVKKESDRWDSYKVR